MGMVLLDNTANYTEFSGRVPVIRETKGLQRFHLPMIDKSFAKYDAASLDQSCFIEGNPTINANGMIGGSSDFINLNLNFSQAATLMVVFKTSTIASNEFIFGNAGSGNASVVLLYNYLNVNYGLQIPSWELDGTTLNSNTDIQVPIVNNAEYTCLFATYQNSGDLVLFNATSQQLVKKTFPANTTVMHAVTTNLPFKLPVLGEGIETNAAAVWDRQLSLQEMNNCFYDIKGALQTVGVNL